jgi:hypothetical protein
MFIPSAEKHVLLICAQDASVLQCDKCGDIAERSRTQAPSASDCLRVGIPVPAGQSCPDLNCHWHMSDLLHI